MPTLISGLSGRPTAVTAGHESGPTRTEHLRCFESNPRRSPAGVASVTLVLGFALCLNSSLLLFPFPTFFLIETRSLPRSLAPTLVVSPSMSLIPFAPFSIFNSASLGAWGRGSVKQEIHERGKA